MKDQTIIRILEQSCAVFSDVPGQNCRRLVPSYNGLLGAAQANHPDHSFLGTLRPISMEKGEERVECEEMHILMVQLRIVLESLSEEGEETENAPPGATRPPAWTGEAVG